MQACNLKYVYLNQTWLHLLHTKQNETKHERDYSNIEPIGYFPFLTLIPEFGRTKSLRICVCEWCFLCFHIIIISQIMIFMSDDRPILYTRSFILKAKHTHLEIGESGQSSKTKNLRRKNKNKNQT